MGLVIVLHEILDDLLGSLDAWPLEALLGRDGLGEEFALLREEWHGANAQLFEPYLDEIREYWREVSVPDARRARIFRDSQRARALEERVNRLKNRVIRGFGHVVSGWDAGEAGRLYDLAARLAGRLGEVCETLNRERLAADDPVSQRLAEEFARRRHRGFRRPLADRLDRLQARGAPAAPVGRGPAPGARHVHPASRPSSRTSRSSGGRRSCTRTS